MLTARITKRISGHVGQAEGIEDAAKDFRLAALEYNEVGGLAKKGGYYETSTIDISSLFNYYSNHSHVVHLRLAPVRKKWRPGSKGSRNINNLQPVPVRSPAARFGFGDTKSPARS